MHEGARLRVQQLRIRTGTIRTGTTITLKATCDFFKKIVSFFSLFGKVYKQITYYFVSIILFMNIINVVFFHPWRNWRDSEAEDSLKDLSQY